MTPEEKKSIQESIEKEIDKLHNEIATLEALLKPIKKDCSLDHAAHQSLQQDQNINIQRYESAKKRLNKLQSTLLKIDSKEYGICKECQEAIALQRLQLIPESEYCVACMEELGV